MNISIIKIDEEMDTNVEKIWKQFNQKLKRFILKRVKDNDTSNDILQEVFIKINENIHSLKDDKKLDKWIYQITRNVIIDHYRKTKWTDPLDICIEEETLPKEAHIKLSRCILPFINQLSVKDREILVLTDIEKIGQKELAEYLGLSYSGAKSRVQRARSKLKDLFQQCCTIEYDKYGTIIDYCKKKSDVDCENPSNL